MRQMTQIALDQPGVESVVGVPRPLHQRLRRQPERRGDVRDARSVRGAHQRGARVPVPSPVRSISKFASIGGAMAAIFPPPPVPGLGAIGGFKLQIEDRGAQGHARCSTRRRQLTAASVTSRRCSPASSRATRWTCRRLFVDVDRERAKQLGVPLDRRATRRCRSTSAPLYVNDFNTARPHLSGDRAGGRRRSARTPMTSGACSCAAAMARWCRSASLATMRPDSGPDPVSRYNAYPRRPTSTAARRRASARARPWPR